MLLERTADGEFLMTVPVCADSLALARAAGARIDTGGAEATCTFADRASLEAALRQLRANPAAGTRRGAFRLTRVSGS